MLAAVALWAVAGAAGQGAGVEYARAGERATQLLGTAGDHPDPELLRLVRTRRGLALQAVATVASVLILIDMVWKLGA